MEIRGFLVYVETPTLNVGAFVEYIMALVVRSVYLSRYSLAVPTNEYVGGILVLHNANVEYNIAV